MRPVHLVLFVMSLLGFSTAKAEARGVEVLKSKVDVNAKSFNEVSHGTQDWTATQ
ncbi:MAG: hypothetical protein AB7G93_10400 [Bdellovibrionales bacterium]